MANAYKSVGSYGKNGRLPGFTVRPTVLLPVAVPHPALRATFPPGEGNALRAGALEKALHISLWRGSAQSLPPRGRWPGEAGSDEEWRALAGL